MKTHSVSLTLLAVLFTLAVSSAAFSADQPVVIVNASTEIDTLEKGEAARIFLGRKTLWASGSRIMPAMLSEKRPSSEAFIRTVLKRSVPQYNAYWKRKLFSGGGAKPPVFRTSAEVAEFVASTPGAIGVVDRAPQDVRIRIVELID